MKHNRKHPRKHGKQFEPVYTSSTLAGAVRMMGDDERAMARDCFEHYRREFRRIAHEAPVNVAHTVHGLLDLRTQDMLTTSPHAPDIQCGKGCAACCHLYVEITPHEADLLLMEADALGIAIDYERLARQALKDDVTWRDLAPEDRRCVFLGDDRACKVYEHRPGACRKYFVKSDPDLCDMHKHPGGKVAIVFSVEAEIVHSAAMTEYGAGNMAAMLLKRSSKT